MKEIPKGEFCQTDYVLESAEELKDFLVQSLTETTRKFALEFIANIFQEEVLQFCGEKAKHKKQENLALRGGSELGWIIMDNQRVKIRKPRIRQDGKELPLKSYKALQSMEHLGEVIKKHMVHGVSTRSYDQVLKKFGDDLGLSKSAVSRLFTKKSREALNYLNSRNFADKEFWALMADGIAFGGSVLIVILGIDTLGNKHILGISEGSSENAEICKDLLDRIWLEKRGIKFTDRILAVVDGSKAIHKGLSDRFGKQIEFQRCSIHKKRNIIAKLNKQYVPEFHEKYNLMIHTVSYKDAKDEFETLYDWLLNRNAEAAKSLAEAGDELLTLQKIKMPADLRNSFYTTNLIESAFSSPRNKMSRVRAWDKKTDQLQRWAAVTFLEQEKMFRKVNGCKHIQSFLLDFCSQKSQNHGEICLTPDAQKQRVHL